MPSLNGTRLRLSAGEVKEAKSFSLATARHDNAESTPSEATSSERAAGSDGSEAHSRQTRTPQSGLIHRPRLRKRVR